MTNKFSKQTEIEITQAISDDTDGKTNPYRQDTEEEECPHDEHDHGICLDCGEDIMDKLISQAEAYGEGER
jgi:Fe2+ or Zn2+ uptake regulation protein